MIISNIRKNIKKNSLPDIFNPDIQEILNDINIDLFYRNEYIDELYYKDNINDIIGLYEIYHNFKYHYENNDIDKFCEYVLIIFFDETYTVEDNLDKRLKTLESIIYKIKEDNNE